MSGTNTSEEMITTIKISTETRDRLADMGKKSESYDTIVNRLIDFWEHHPAGIDHRTL
jgi:hypothetical protein